ncbi:hypothetical protein [Microbulbifer sp. SSSA005]|uniref:hypothetical protein n=1 Tax=Microbulbifer sp. SSSA005 TaxID=3243378 RepID=UPI0040393634
MARTHESFAIEDGTIYQVRKDNEQAFFAQQDHRRHQIEAGAVKEDYRRLRFSIPATIQLEIIKKYGKEMDPIRYGKMSPAEKRKFDQIIHSEFPRCIMGRSQKFFEGIQWQSPITAN